YCQCRTAFFVPMFHRFSRNKIPGIPSLSCAFSLAEGLPSSHIFLIRQEDACMSRSRKHTPVSGLSNSESEKKDKVRAHRTERHAVKSKLSETLDQDVIGSEHKRSRGWTFAKDGKRFLKHPSDKDLRK